MMLRFDAYTMPLRAKLLCTHSPMGCPRFQCISENSAGLPYHLSTLKADNHWYLWLFLQVGIQSDDTESMALTCCHQTDKSANIQIRTVGKSQAGTAKLTTNYRGKISVHFLQYVQHSRILSLHTNLLPTILSHIHLQ